MAQAYGEWLRGNPGGTRAEHADYLAGLARAAQAANEPRTPEAVLTRALDGYDEMAYTAGMVAGVLAGLAENGYAIIDVSPDGPGHHTTAELDDALRLSGEDFTEGAGPDATCGCGESITYYDGTWLHIINPELRGTDDHDAEPDDPDSVDWSDYEDEEEEDG